MADIIETLARELDIDIKQVQRTIELIDGKYNSLHSEYRKEVTGDLMILYLGSYMKN